MVAQKLGRKYCGVEINHEYCLWAVKRLINVESDRSIQGYADGVFWERNSLGDQKANKPSSKGAIVEEQTILF